jgi:pimeloyl-ACP methyl ester carboxylesterase
MLLHVDGLPAHASTAGGRFDSDLPCIAFLHGAGLDHSVWALQSRWFSHHGWSVLAFDLPGHGRSEGEPLASIEAMADWVIRALAAAGVPRAKLVGHSMGSLVALEAAHRHPDKVSALALAGAAAAMPVSAELLAAARANDHAAVDMVSLWGTGFTATLGGSKAPGLWMLGGAGRLLERAAPGVLFAGLAACNAYRGGLEAAASIGVPAMLILGERDMMTPAKAGRALAAAIKGARLRVFPGAGHMLMAERPDDVLKALIA